jgi:predicted transcriptional regulator of viral defense system
MISRMTSSQSPFLPVRVSRGGVLRSRDLERLGVSRTSVGALLESGDLLRVARGVYVPATHELTEKHSLAVACARVPHGIICLLSALAFHGLTVQNPSSVWMAIAPSARKPAPSMPPIRIARFSGPALTSGIEIHRTEGVRIRVYSVAKTVADLFKYRNKIGTDVAVEALRETLRTRRASMNEIVRAAKICRVSRVMKPYLEAIQ